MTQPATQFDDSSPPDWEALRAVSLRIEDLHARAALTRELWEQGLAEAKQAVNGHEEFLEAIMLFAEPEWVE